MNARQRHFGLFCFMIAFFVASFWGFGRPVWALEPAAARLKAAASIFALADMAHQIGGNQVEVVTVLPAGANPHTFELNPGKAGTLEGARIIFTVGHGFDDWLLSAGENFSTARIVTVDGGIDLITAGAVDPHYWLSLRNARRMAETMAQELSAMVPQKEMIKENLKNYLERLDETDREIQNLFSDVKNRKIITAHNAWAYFARDYGFEILGAIESPSGEPTPKHLADLGRAVRKEGVHTLFAQPQVPKDMIQAFADDFHLQIYELDPVENSQKDKTYTDRMIQNARVIKQALKT